MDIKSFLKFFSLSIVIGIFSLQVFSAHGFHTWDKISETRSESGKIVCEWICDPLMEEPHTRYTTGYSYCPQPF